MSDNKSQTMDFKSPEVTKQPDKPKTPRKKRPTPIEMGSDGSPGPSTPSKKPRKAVKKEQNSPDDKQKVTPSKAVPIPKSYEEATEADRKLIQMKEAGEKIEDIQTMWEGLTGISPAKGTLRMRYTRIKENLACLNAKERDLLLKAQKQYEEQKWVTITDIMVKISGGKKYTAGLLIKESKRIEQEKKDGTFQAYVSEPEDNEEAETDKEPMDPGSGERPKHFKLEPEDEDEEMEAAVAA